MKTLSINRSVKTSSKTKDSINETLSISQKSKINGCETYLTYKLIITSDNNRLQESFSENCGSVYSILIIEEKKDEFGYSYDTEFIYDISRSREQAEYITMLLGSNRVPPEKARDIICDNI